MIELLKYCIICTNICCCYMQWLYGIFMVVYMIVNVVVAPKEKQQRKAD